MKDEDNYKDKYKDKFIYLFEKHQRGKPNSKENPRGGYTNPRSGNFVDPSNKTSINVNGSLQSWLSDEDIIVNASFHENFRSIISGPSECGKTFLLREI